MILWNLKKSIFIYNYEIVNAYPNFKALHHYFYLTLTPHEFHTWTLQSLNLDTFVVVNRGFSREAIEWQTVSVLMRRLVTSRLIMAWPVLLAKVFVLVCRMKGLKFNVITFLVLTLLCSLFWWYFSPSFRWMYFLQPGYLRFSRTVDSKYNYILLL